MSITGAIGSFKTGSYTVTRTTKGSYVSGRYVEGSSTAFTVDANVQPMMGEELQSLPEGQHGNQVKKVFTDGIPLYSESDTYDPDRIVLDGDTYEVFAVEKWEAFGTTHYMAKVSKLQ